MNKWSVLLVFALSTLSFNCENEIERFDYYGEGAQNYVVNIDALDQDPIFAFPYANGSGLDDLEQDLQLYFDEEDPEATATISVDISTRVIMINIRNTSLNFEYMVLGGNTPAGPFDTIHFDKTLHQ